jgi:hypothetical protein
MKTIYMTQEEMNASIEIGEIIETDKGEKLRCVSIEDGVPQWEALTNMTMDFGGAIKALKEGHKVARKGWNGKGMFLWLKPATEVKAEWCKDPLLKSLAEENGGSIAALGTICMYTHDSTGRNAILTGWLASQSDMLLEDWLIVE